jgi:NADP-dependent 3-hydroxy acid dehydrogenase YdfG
LIDPFTRYAQHETELPPPGFPILQTNFTTPPDCGEESYQGSRKLQGLNVLVTGGDSGIGRATVIAFAREGANVAINYLPAEEPDAKDLEDLLAAEDLSLTRIPGNLDDEAFCGFLIGEAASRLGGLDILIGNAG